MLVCDAWSRGSVTNRSGTVIHPVLLGEHPASIVTYAARHPALPYTNSAASACCLIALNRLSANVRSCSFANKTWGFGITWELL
jgi:hypothetical protein